MELEVEVVVLGQSLPDYLGRLASDYLDDWTVWIIWVIVLVTHRRGLFCSRLLFDTLSTLKTTGLYGERTSIEGYT